MTPLEIAELWEKLELELTSSLRCNLERHKAQEAREGGQNGVPEHWEDWQAAKLRDVRRFRRENEALLGRYAPKINTETEKMLEEQYAEGGSDGFFRSSDARLRALMDEMQNNEARVERASLRYMDDVYRRTILRTATALNAGGMTYQKAVDEATKDFLAQGINCVEYANGRCVNIASYAEMALRTCATRAMLMGEARKREALGVDTVLVSQYGACSDTCLPWQGRVYIDDVFQNYNGPRGGSFGVSRNGKQYMFLSIAMKGGLFHPNCRHTISTWVEGISRKPEPMDIAEIERTNKLEAVQRRMEWAIRKAKRKASGLQDPAARKEAKAQVRQLQADLREFISDNGDVLRRDYWRERDSLGIKPSKEVAALPSSEHKPEVENKPFKIENALQDYRKFLTSVPREYKMYLEQSLDAVSYKETDNPRLVMGYSAKNDAVYYNPENPEFAHFDFSVANTHELAHRVDRMFFRSADSPGFSGAIGKCMAVVDASPDKFTEFCATHDSDGLLSDIVDAMCESKYQLPAYHGAEYWARPGKKNEEIFANLFSLYALGDAQKLKFLQENFPELIAQFSELMEGGL